jgi:hypothetical protein
MNTVLVVLLVVIFFVRDLQNRLASSKKNLEPAGYQTIAASSSS